MCHDSQLVPIYMFSVHPAAFPKYVSKTIFSPLQHHPAVISEGFTLGSQLILLTSVFEL